MRNRNKALLAAAALCASVGFTIDAHATTFVSPSSTEYFSITLTPGSGFSLPQGSDATILIDDVTFAGEPSEVCNAESACSVFDVPGGNGVPGLGTGSFFPDLIGSGTSVWSTTAGFTGLGTSMSFSSSNSDLRSGTDARRWHHSMTLLDEDGPNESWTIDEFTLSGAAFWVMREASASGSFATITSPDAFIDPGSGLAMSGGLTGGAGGAGMAIGTGVGAAGWVTPTSQSRHYQSPHVVRGISVSLTASLFAGGRAHVKGRVINDPNEAPAVNQSLVVTTAP